METVQGVLSGVLEKKSVFITSSGIVLVGYTVRRTKPRGLPYFVLLAENVSHRDDELRDLLGMRPPPSSAVLRSLRRQPSNRRGSLPPLPRERGGVPPDLRPCTDMRCLLRLRRGLHRRRRS